MAARAGVSKGTLYLYFDSKEALFKAVIQDRVEAVMSEGEALLASLQDDPVRLLREILMGWWELIGATDLGGIPKVMIAEAHNFPEVARYFNEDVISRGRAVVASALRLGIERGLFRVVDVPATVQVLMAPLIMLSVWRNSMAVCDPPRAGRGLSASLFRCRFQGPADRPGFRSLAMKVRIFLLPLAATCCLPPAPRSRSRKRRRWRCWCVPQGPAAPSTWRSIPATCVPATRPSWASGWPASSPRAWSTAVRV